MLLDACVLVPYHLANVLLVLADEGLYRPRWSDRILAETERTLTTKLGLSADRVAWRIGSMRAAFPEASVQRYEHLEDGLGCDPKDRHVLAAAIAAHADLLVTANLRDFPPDACTPFGIAPESPDSFLCALLDHEPEAVLDGLRQVAKRTRRPPLSDRDVVENLTRVAPDFAGECRGRLETLAPPPPAGP